MRGAQPDAECPRCSHVQPPADPLVTCARCGLAFVPKEIQHRLKRREPEPEAELPALVPPPSLSVTEEGDRLVISWPDNQRAGYLAIFAAVATSPIVFLSLLGTGAKVGYLLFLAGLAVSGRQMSRRRPRLWIDRDHLSNPLGDSFPLATVAAISVDGARVSALNHDGNSIQIKTLDRRAAAFIADLLTRRLDERQLDSGTVPDLATPPD